MNTRIIGIDFGTSTTVVRVHNVGAGNKILPVLVNGQRTIPTIAFRKEGSEEMYYGYDAQMKIESNAKGTVYKNFKMNLISDDEELRKQTEILIQGFMEYVYKQYQKLLNDGAFESADKVKVYVSHPAKWNSSARTLMKESVAKAGFCGQENITLKDEPTAAFLAVMHDKNDVLKQSGMLYEGKKYKAMMIDMGAGTTDIVLCTYMVKDGKLHIDNIFTYPPINAPGLCGGREIDYALLREAETFLEKMQGHSTEFGKKVIRKMSKDVKSWKEQTLSSSLKNGDTVPEPDAITEFRETLINFGVPVKNDDERFSISRKFFEEFTKDHWIQWENLLKGSFSEVQESQYDDLECPKTPEDVDLLIVTGGHSQWYIVDAYILGKSSYLSPMNFAKIRNNPICLIQSPDPQETVAVGLCHMDEDVVGTIAASNDVSISFTCEGKYLGSCDLINKGVPLPFEKKDIVIKNGIDGNFLRRRELIIEYSIITDKTNTITKSQVVPSSGIIEIIIKTVISTLCVAIFDIPRILYCCVRGKWDQLDDTIVSEIFSHNYPIELSPNIYVNEEGIIKVGGTISVDGEKLNIPEIVT